MAARSDERLISPFREALYTISEGLTDQQVKSLKYLSMEHLTAIQKETADALELFEILEKRGNISDTSYQFIIDLLEKIHREDLKKKFLQIVKNGKYYFFYLVFTICYLGPLKKSPVSGLHTHQVRPVHQHF